MRVPSQLPIDREARWALLDDTLRRWFPVVRHVNPVDPAELARTEARLGVGLPIALREWFDKYGDRTDVWCLQDRLLRPDAWHIEGDVIVFAVENQGVVRWGTRREALGDDDPEVVVSDPAGGRDWFTEAGTVTSFALQFAHLNVKWTDATSYRANGPLSDQALSAIERGYRRLPFPDMRWPSQPTRFYGDGEVLIEIQGSTWIWVTARTSTALANVDELVRRAGVDWESFDSRG